MEGERNKPPVVTISSLWPPAVNTLMSKLFSNAVASLRRYMGSFPQVSKHIMCYPHRHQFFLLLEGKLMDAHAHIHVYRVYQKQFRMSVGEMHPRNNFFSLRNIGSICAFVFYIYKCSQRYLSRYNFTLRIQPKCIETQVPQLFATVSNCFTITNI